MLNDGLQHYYYELLISNTLSSKFSYIPQIDYNWLNIFSHLLQRRRLRKFCSPWTLIRNVFQIIKCYNV